MVGSLQRTLDEPDRSRGSGDDGSIWASAASASGGGKNDTLVALGGPAPRHGRRRRRGCRSPRARSTTRPDRRPGRRCRRDRGGDEVGVERHELRPKLSPWSTLSAMNGSDRPTRRAVVVDRHHRVDDRLERSGRLGLGDRVAHDRRSGQLGEDDAVGALAGGGERLGGARRPARAAAPVERVEANSCSSTVLAVVVTVSPASRRRTEVITSVRAPSPARRGGRRSAPSARTPWPMPPMTRPGARRASVANSIAVVEALRGGGQDADADAQPFGVRQGGRRQRDAGGVEAVLDDPQLVDAAGLEPFGEPDDDGRFELAREADAEGAVMRSPGHHGRSGGVQNGWLRRRGCARRRRVDRRRPG